jgi:hypothetical protein
MFRVGNAHVPEGRIEGELLPLPPVFLIDSFDMKSF